MEVSNKTSREVGLGPHPEPWPVGDHFDAELLRHGDRRNVIDRYRYWKVSAIVADLDPLRHPFHVAIENWEHDRNIGTVVRTANAFLAMAVHIIGRRRWNRRGAMMTEVYQHLHHHASVDDLVAWARRENLPVIGVDNIAGSVPLETAELPKRCVLLFGQEGPGLSAAAREAASKVVHIAQYGSTRSLNAGVAAGIAMHAWIRCWATQKTAISGTTTHGTDTHETATHGTDTPVTATSATAQHKTTLHGTAMPVTATFGSSQHKTATHEPPAPAR